MDVIVYAAVVDSIFVISVVKLQSAIMVLVSAILH